MIMLMLSVTPKKQKQFLQHVRKKEQKQFHVQSAVKQFQKQKFLHSVIQK